MRKLIFPMIFITLVYTLQSFASLGDYQWSVTYNNGGRIYAIVINPTNANIMYIAGLDSGVYKTTNGGLNWFAVNNGLSYNKVQCLDISKSNPNVLYAGTDQNGGSLSGVYVTTDAGATWFYKSTGITDSKGIQQIVIHPTNPNIAYIGVFDGVVASTIGLYKTTDGGNNWFASNAGIDNYNILSIVFNPLNPNVMYCGTSLILPSSGPSKIYKSYNGGANWFAVTNGLPTGTTVGNPVRAMSMTTADTSLVLAALFVNDTTGGVYITTNGGQLWQKKYSVLPNTVGTLYRACIIKPGSTLEMYVGIDQSSAQTPRGVYRSTDGGNTWTDFSGAALLNTYTIRAFAFRTTGNPRLYAGAAHPTLYDGRGVFEYTWVAIGTGNNPPNLPNHYYLKQNYPNPFNPVTTIKFGIPKSDFVYIQVFDLIGRKVKTLVSEYKQAGEYIVEFDGSNLSSGLYYYRLNAGKFSETKKMILLK